MTTEGQFKFALVRYDGQIVAEAEMTWKAADYLNMLKTYCADWPDQEDATWVMKSTYDRVCEDMAKTEKGSL